MSSFQYQYNDADPMRGGGFSESQSPNAGAGFSSPGDGSAQQNKFGNKDEQSIIPVTVNMLLHAVNVQTPGGGSAQSFTLADPDGREIKFVKLVAAVKEVAHKSSFYTWIVEDGTGGNLEVRKHHSPDGSGAPLEEQIQDSMYVVVMGEMKEYESRRYLQSLSVRLIATGNQVTHHFLEVIYSHERHLKQQTLGGGGTNPIYQPALPKQQGQALQSIPQSGGGGGASNVYQTLMDSMRHLMDSGMGNEEAGVHITSIFEEMARRGVVEERQVREAIDYASTDGVVYSTTDEYHYAFSA